MSEDEVKVLQLQDGVHAESDGKSVKIVVRPAKPTTTLPRSVSMEIDLESLRAVCDFAFPPDHSVDVTDMTDQLADELIAWHESESILDDGGIDHIGKAISLAREIRADRKG